MYRSEILSGSFASTWRDNYGTLCNVFYNFVGHVPEYRGMGFGSEPQTKQTEDVGPTFKLER